MPPDAFGRGRTIDHPQPAAWSAPCRAAWSVCLTLLCRPAELAVAHQAHPSTDRTGVNGLLRRPGDPRVGAAGAAMSRGWRPGPQGVIPNAATIYRNNVQADPTHPAQPGTHGSPQVRKGLVQRDRNQLKVAPDEPARHRLQPTRQISGDCNILSQSAARQRTIKPKLNRYGYCCDRECQYNLL